MTHQHVIENRKWRTCAGFLAITAIGLVAPPSSAQDITPRRDPALAEALFKEARQRMEAKDYAQACPKFAESYRLDPGLGTLVNLAKCHESQGKIATAWGEYKDAEAQAITAGDKSRQKFAAQRAKDLEPKLPKLVLSMSDPPTGLKLSRDGVTLSVASLGTLLPVDPGKHQIEAVAPGYKTWSTEIVAKEGKRVDVEIPELIKEPPKPDISEKPVDSKANQDKPEASGGGGRRVAGLVLGAVGVAGLVAGGVFTGLTAAKKGAADDDPGCGKPGDEGKIICSPEAYENINAANTFAWGANIGFGAGAALVVVGGILFLTSGDSKSTAKDKSASAHTNSPPRVSVIPSVGPQGGGLAANVRF